jgi:DNA-binding beta-propeller fold protein YncE
VIRIWALALCLFCVVGCGGSAAPPPAQSSPPPVDDSGGNSGSPPPSDDPLPAPPDDGDDGGDPDEPVDDEGEDMPLPTEPPFSGFLPVAPYTHFESPQTSPLRLSPEGDRLFAVDTAANRLVVFSLQNPASPLRMADIPVALEPVSVLPLSADEAWVVNHVSRNIQIVSVAAGRVIATLPAGNEPADIVLAGNPARVFVSAARDNQLRAYDPVSGEMLAVISLQGEQPRAMAASADRRYLYVVFALGGNGTTFLPAWENPYAEPAVEGLPAAPPVGRIIRADDPEFADVIRFTLLDHDLARIDTETGEVHYREGLGTVNFALALHPGNGDLYVAGTEALNERFFLPALRDDFVRHRLVQIGSEGVAFHDLNPFHQAPELSADARRALALAQPVALQFEPGGDHLWVAAMGSDKVARVTASGDVVARVDLAGGDLSSRNFRGPRGLAMSAGGQYLYVLNRVSSTLQVIRLADRLIVAEQPLSERRPVPQSIAEGRGYLYDARLSMSGTSSCAVCHVDGGTDHLAWNLGDPDGRMIYIRDPQSGERFAMHPMKGPMVTQHLSGLKGTGPFHWRGDMPDLFAFNVLFEKLFASSRLGDDDMSLFVSYLESIALHANPYRQLDGSLPAMLKGFDPVAGAHEFDNAGRCGQCHGMPNTEFVFRMAINGRQNPAKVALPRHAYKKDGYRNMPGAISTIGFGTAQDGRISGFVGEDARAFAYAWDTGTAPTVGHAISVAAESLSEAELDWQILEMRADVLANDIVVHGLADGQSGGWLYRRASSDYLDCLDESSAPRVHTRQQLVAAVAEGIALLMVLGLPPGNGSCAYFDGALSGH